MTVAALVLLLLPLDVDVEALVKQGKYEEAVAQARDPDTLLKATIASGKPGYARGIVQEVVLLRGVLKEPGRAADWLVRLSRHQPFRDEALTSAGYLYLRAGKSAKAVTVLEDAVRTKRSGIGLVYLGDAYRRAGLDDKAKKTLVAAAKLKDAPQRYLQDSALALAARMRGKRDDTYADLLAAVGLSLKAAVWLKEDAFYAGSPGKAKKARKRALDLFRRGLDPSAPATAFWEAATMADGNERFGWLVEAVRRGRTPEGHAVPSALLDLARECAQRKRYVAALSLAQERLRLGDCPAAWEIIESLPPQTRAP